MDRNSKRAVWSKSDICGVVSSRGGGLKSARWRQQAWDHQTRLHETHGGPWVLHEEIGRHGDTKEQRTPEKKNCSLLCLIIEKLIMKRTTVLVCAARSSHCRCSEGGQMGPFLKSHTFSGGDIIRSLLKVLRREAGLAKASPL